MMALWLVFLHLKRDSSLRFDKKILRHIFTLPQHFRCLSMRKAAAIDDILFTGSARVTGYED